MPEISIIILNYGPVDIVVPCLAQLKVHHDSGLAEVIFVDNGSPGFPVEDFRSSFPWVNLIANNRNLGFAAGNNLGIRTARGRYVLLLNPDTRVPEEVLPAMLQYMESSPGVGAATCRVNLADGSLDQACHRGFPTPWASFCYFLGLDRILPRSRFFGGYHLTYKDLNTTHEIDSPSGCFFLVRRAVLDQVGLLDETFFMYGEDIDWAMRIKQAGWKVVYHPEVSIIHLKGLSSGIKHSTAGQSAASTSDRLRAHHAFYEAMRVFYRKHYLRRYPAPVGWAVLTAVTIKEKLSQRRLRV
ncbi:MAG: glycosyltransferase family 2 protein [candidate division WOR-3 bacterium]